MALAQDNTAFACDLYQKLKEREGNLFFSPYSISSALAMACAGARGDTAEQMEKALHFTPGAALHAEFAALFAQLLQAESGVQLKIANALWPQAGYPFLAEYLGLIRTYYGEEITPLDYNDTEAARQMINGWVRDKTESKIQELIPAGVLNALTRLVLTNAIYFKGKWASPFDAQKSRVMPFLLQENQTVPVPYMVQHGRFRCAELDRLQVLEMLYGDGQFSMVILLPQMGGLRLLEDRLKPENLHDWLSKLLPCTAALSIPRFTYSADFHLNQALAALGMTDAFRADSANFAGMDGNPNWLYISAVLHKAFIDVNEEGADAAAATAVVMRSRGALQPDVIFTADHPFIFLIRENKTGSILFLGRMMNPTL